MRSYEQGTIANKSLLKFLFYGSTVLKDGREELQRLLPEGGEAQGLGQRRQEQRSTPTAELSPREALEGSLVLLGASCASLGIVVRVDQVALGWCHGLAGDSVISWQQHPCSTLSAKFVRNTLQEIVARVDRVSLPRTPTCICGCETGALGLQSCHVCAGDPVITWQQLPHSPQSQSL